MTTHDAFERTLSAWLHEDGEHHVSDHLGEILQRTAATRQRPAWWSLERLFSMDTTFARRLAPTWQPAWLLAILAALIVAIATVAVIGNLPRPLPAPFGPAENGALVFENDGDIVTLAADGTPSVLVGGPTNDFGPWFSRDGSTFSFLREDSGESLQVMAADADGSNVRPLTTEPLFQPDWSEWSPSGTQMAVFHTIETRPVISILEADGSGTLTTLDLGDVVPEGWVDWLPPDGQELIFRGSPRDRDTSRGLFAIGVDGTNLREVAPIVPNRNAYQDIDLAPDGSRLLFWNFEADRSDDGAGGYTHLLNLTTDVDTKTTFDPEAGEAIRAVFSPAGTEIAAATLGSRAQVIVAPADAPVQGHIAIGSTFAYDTPYAFDFSPDGRQVIQTIGTMTRIFRVSDGQMLSGSSHAFPTWQRRAP